MAGYFRTLTVIALLALPAVYADSIADLSPTSAAIAEEAMRQLVAREQELAAKQPHDGDGVTAVKKSVFEHSSVRLFGDSWTVENEFIIAVANEMNTSVEATLNVVENLTLPSCLYIPPTCDPAYPYRTYDGSCNNLKHPLYGRALTPFKRLIPSDCSPTDGYWKKAKDHSDLPNARTVSEKATSPKPGYLQAHHTTMVMHFGQFLDHDITLTAVATLASVDGSGVMTCGDGGCDPSYHPACKPIATTGRPTPCIPFTRSLGVVNADCTVGRREQLNEISSFIDGSGVYGSSHEEAVSLRDTNSSCGKMWSSLSTGEELLPTVDHPTCVRKSTPKCFAAGDIRVNEQGGLTSLHTLFVREHNRVEAKLREDNPSWDGEKLFQITRKIIGAIIQHITYNEFLPRLLTKGMMKKYDLNLLTEGFKTTYSEDVDPSILNEFAAAAYRMGHSMIPDELYRPSSPNLRLSDIFFTPDYMYDGLDGLYHGMATQRGHRVDNLFAESVREQLFGHDDLVALNINRGRDHCLPSYMRLHRYFRPTGRLPIPKVLHDLYTDDDDIDPFIGCLYEKRGKGSLGRTFSNIIATQFQRLRDGDRFWYENEGQFTADQLAAIRNVSMSKVICNNAKNLTKMPMNSFKNMRFSHREGQNRMQPCADFPDMDLSAWKE